MNAQSVFESIGVDERQKRTEHENALNHMCGQGMITRKLFIIFPCTCAFLLPGRANVAYRKLPKFQTYNVTIAKALYSTLTSLNHLQIAHMAYNHSVYNVSQQCLLFFLVLLFCRNLPSGG